MFRRLIAAVFLSSSLYLLTGCAGPSKTVVNKESIPYFTETKILSVTLMNGEVVTFDREGAQYHERYQNKKRVIVGRTEQGQRVEIALDNVRKARLENNNEVDTRGLFFPTFLIIGLVVAIL